MNTTKAVTVRLDADEYSRLETEAARLGLRPGELARRIVRDRLVSPTETESESERKRRVGLEALARLSEMRVEIRRDGYPSVDAVELAQQLREELDERPHL